MAPELGQRRVASVGCPHCDNHDVVRWGKASDLPRYRCKACSRTFNALTKTPLANLRMKDKWTTQTEAMIDGWGFPAGHKLPVAGRSLEIAYRIDRTNGTARDRSTFSVRLFVSHIHILIQQPFARKLLLNRYLPGMASYAIRASVDI